MTFLVMTISSLVAFRDIEVERLIDRLQDLGKHTVGAHPTAWTGGFLAIDEEPEFRGGILGSAKPSVDPTLRALVRLGVRALPGLIRHLSDSRRTELVESHQTTFGAMWFADEYDPRFRDPKRQPHGVNSEERLGSEFRNMPPNATYRFRVGDICYIVVGQIVSRGLSALRYQPTNCKVINSPVHTPSLAAAVVRDWSGLTADSHRAQLENDAYSVMPFESPEAVKRLMFYYPPVGERIALRLLRRRLYDHIAVWKFADDLIMKTDRREEWRRLLGVASRSFGQGASLLPHWIYWSNWETSMDHPKAQQARASRLLKTIFPSFNPYRNRFYAVADFDDQVDLIKSLKQFPNKKVDEAVQDLFRRACAVKILGGSDGAVSRRIAKDELAMACAERMVAKGHRLQYASFFRTRVAAIRAMSKDSTERYRLNELEQWLKRSSLSSR